MYIVNYKQFLLEFSKNDPFPELTWNKKGKNAIFLFGFPCAGKSHFTENVLLPKLNNYKIFDPDKMMLLFHKAFKKGILKNKKGRETFTEEEKLKKVDKIKDTFAKLSAEYEIDVHISDDEIKDIIDNNIFYKDAYVVLDKNIRNFLAENRKADLVYDTTGNDYDRIETYTNMCKDYGYNIIFIKVRSSVKSAVQGNLARKRKVQPDYQLSSIERSEELEQFYLDLEPDAYYIYERDINALFKFDGSDLRLQKDRLIKNG